MKIKIAYLPHEERRAAAVLSAVLRICKGAGVRKSERHPPYTHLYVTSDGQEGTHKGA